MENSDTSYEPLRKKNSSPFFSLPLEIFLQILFYLPAPDVRTYRYVSKWWNLAAADSMRGPHSSPAIFQDSEKIKTFLVLMRSAIQPLPFSTFHFKWEKVGLEVLREFIEVYAPQVQGYIFSGRRLTGIDVPRVSPDPDSIKAYVAYGKILSTALLQAPRLTYLEIGTYDFVFRLSEELQFPNCLPYLKKLKVTLSYFYHVNRGESWLEKIVKASPSLSIVSLYYKGLNQMNRGRLILDPLPDLLRNLSRLIKVKINLDRLYIYDNVTMIHIKDILKELIESGSKISSISIGRIMMFPYVKLLFQWIEMQPLVHLSIDEIGKRWNNWSCSSSANFHNLQYLKLPYKLRATTSDFDVLEDLASKLPKLKHLSLRMYHENETAHIEWCSFTGENQQKKLDDILSTEDGENNRSPFKTMKVLRSLEICRLFPTSLSALVYISKNKSLHSLEMLRLIVDPDEFPDFDKFMELLIPYHDAVRLQKFSWSGKRH